MGYDLTIGRFYLLYWIGDGPLVLCIKNWYQWRQKYSSIDVQYASSFSNTCNIIFNVKIWQNQNLEVIYKMWIKLLGNAIQIAVTFTLELVNDPNPRPNVITPTWTRLKLQKMM